MGLKHIEQLWHASCAFLFLPGNLIHFNCIVYLDYKPQRSVETDSARYEREGLCVIAAAATTTTEESESSAKCLSLSVLMCARSEGKKERKEEGKTGLLIFIPSPYQ